MTTIIAGILMLGVLVFVHELGHFMVAKFCRVKVLKFSLGFGPKLLSRQWGETEYLICAIPLGGYVQMLGEGNGEQGEDAELSAEERARSFADKPVSNRLAIVSAGPLMNLLLPFLILPISFMIGVQVPSYVDQKPCIGYVVPGSNAA
ncbi:MAG: site-2 protease family protein, partial [Deltaproteobacteria bacterium]|nr:site-2 protease family protein [Deltaproteobacteria bacterium]